MIVDGLGAVASPFSSKPIKSLFGQSQINYGAFPNNLPRKALYLTVLTICKVLYVRRNFRTCLSECHDVRQQFGQGRYDINADATSQRIVSHTTLRTLPRSRCCAPLNQKESEATLRFADWFNTASDSVSQRNPPCGIWLCSIYVSSTISGPPG